MDSIKEPDYGEDKATTFLYIDTMNLKNEARFQFAEPFDLRPCKETKLLRKTKERKPSNQFHKRILTRENSLNCAKDVMLIEENSRSPQ